MSCVVQIVQHLKPGGIETMALSLHERYLRHGRSFIVSLEGSRSTALKRWPRLLEHDAHLIFLGKQGGVDVRMLWRLLRVLKSLKPTAIHSHHIGPLLYGGLAARLKGIRCHVHTEHDAWHLQNEKRRHLQALMLQFAKPKWVADADLVAASARQLIQRNDISVIHNGVDTERFCPADQQRARSMLGLPRPGLWIGCAARLEPEKGHIYLLRALTKLPQAVELVLAGDGSLRFELEQLSHALNIAHRVHFLGYVANMPAFYQALDVFCLASKNEGLPLSAMEAQACNIPSVLTDVGGCREALDHDSGRLVGWAQVQELAESLREVLAQSGRQMPRGFIERHRSLDQMSQAYLKLLNPDMLQEIRYA